MSLYKNRYRIESARLNNWDYSSKGYYFITICTKNRKHFFGNIKNGEMKLSKIGKIVLQYWQEIPNHFPFVKLDEFIFMPDHMHAIIIIGDHAMKIPTLGIIISQYKRKCTIVSRKIDPTFGWLPRFHDHIIRNNGAFNRIRDYIQNNPLNWKKGNLHTG